MSDSPQAEPAVTRRSSRTPAASAPATPEIAPALTRAELRRRAQASIGQEPALTRRSTRPPQSVSALDLSAAVASESAADAPAEGGVADVTLLAGLAAPVDAAGLDDLAAEDLAVDGLPDLAPEPRELPAHPRDVPVVVETAAAAVDATPAALPTSPITLPSRRVRRAAGASTSAAAAPTEAIQPGAAGEWLDDAASTPPSVADPAADAGPDLEHDAFEAAARLFSFPGETPVEVAAAAFAEETAPEDVAAVGVARRAPRRGVSFTRVATASFSICVVGVVGLLAVGMTTPIEAVAAARGVTSTAVSAAMSRVSETARASARDDIQAYVAPAEVENAGVKRDDGFRAASMAQLAAESGISNFSNFFVNDPNSAIQWPFAVGVPITYGFGMRSGTMHEGLDFVPGAGSPIQAIADGTVRIATESGGAYGVTVVIDHVIDGELVSSRYAHMQYGSLQVSPGDRVTVGTFLGRTGNTGRSFGAHTHFEILQNGTTAIDPLPWLRARAGG